MREPSARNQKYSSRPAAFQYSRSAATRTAAENNRTENSTAFRHSQAASFTQR